eukprot:s3984_g9.t1
MGCDCKSSHFSSLLAWLNWYACGCRAPSRRGLLFQPEQATRGRDAELRSPTNQFGFATLRSLPRVVQQSCHSIVPDPKAVNEDTCKPHRILSPCIPQTFLQLRKHSRTWVGPFDMASSSRPEMHSERHLDHDASQAGTPLLTAEEEMQYQRALWVNRFLKEQLAAQTQGLSLKEIEEAQTQIQARMRQATRLQAWTSSQGPDPASARTIYAKSPRRSQTQQARPQVVSSCEVNRRRAQHRIKEENLGILQRIENVKSSFTPRMPSNLIPKISPRNRLLNHGH